jgi:AcrR family transcriptional regulator
VHDGVHEAPQDIVETRYFQISKPSAHRFGNAVCQNHWVSSPRRYRGIPTEERQRARRERLVDAALSVIADGGASALTVNRVCSTAGLNPRYYYEHFKSLDELVLAIAEQTGQLVVSTLVDALAHTHPDIAAQAEAAVSAGVGLLVDDPRLARLVVESATHPVLLVAREDFKKALLALIIANRPTGPNPPTPDPDQTAEFAANMLLGGLLEVLGAWTAGNLAMNRNELIAKCVEVTLILGDLAAGQADAS